MKDTCSYSDLKRFNISCRYATESCQKAAMEGFASEVPEAAF